MSSSRIIKSDVGTIPFAGFAFHELRADEPHDSGVSTEGGFMPFMPGAVQNPPSTPSASAEEDAEPKEVVVAGIPEEEVAVRVQEAFAEGLREGRRQAEESLAKVSEALAKALLSTGGLRQKLMQESEEDLLKLAVTIARKIILQEISIDRRILLNIVRAAVSNVSEGDEVVVRLNPADYEIVADNREFMPAANEKRRMTLKPDDSIPEGGCLVDTSMGAIDARIDAQLDEVFRRFMEDRTFDPEESDNSVTEEETNALGED